MAGIMRRKGEKRVYTGREEVNTGEYKGGALRAKGQSRSGLTVGETVGYAAKRAGTDFLRVGEGVVDAALVPIDLLTGNVEQAKSRFLDSPVDAMRERLDEEYNPGKVAGFIGDIAGGMGQSIGYGLISAIPYAGKPMMYSSIIEQSISSAAEKTGEVGWKEVGYGATAGAVEGLLESKLGAGVNAAKGIGSAILKKTGINVAESAAKAGGKSLLKTLAIDTAKGFAGEFGEEFVSEAVDPKLQNIWGIDKDARFSLKDSFRAGIVGGISGGAISIGPSAINYKSSVSVGRALQESGLDGELIKRARYTLSALEAAQTRSTGQIKGKPEGDSKETAKEWLSRTSENRKVKRLSRETKELADKIRRNIQAYENSMKDPAMAQSEPVAALLGELRGNLFLVGYAYEADVIEQVMMEADDKQRQAFVDAINEELAAQGKKHDYTLADFDANKDDIRRGLAGLLMEDELQGNTAEGGAEAPQKPAQASTSPWDGMADNEDMSGYKATGDAENALLRAAVNQSVPRGSVQAMLDEYRKGTDLTPEEFAEGWSDGVHLIGRYGLKVDETAESAYNRLPQSARETATRIGKETAETERKAAEEKAKAKKKPAEQAGKKGTVVRGEGLNVQKLSDEQYAAYKGAEVLAEKLGTDIVIENSIEERGHTVNGYFDPKTNRIHININALHNGKNIALYTLGHEVTHYIKEWSPTKFEALADFVMDQMGVDAETAIADKLASLKRLGIVKDTMTMAEANAIAREELVAEGMELVLTDGKVLEELAKTDKTLWEKIRDWFFDIIGQIRRSWQDLNQASKTAHVLKETVESLEEIERLFTEGVREAGERTRTAGVETVTRMNEGEVVYSSNSQYDFTKPFGQQIEDYKNGLFPKQDALLLGATPDIYQNIGFNALPMTINQTHVDYALNGTKDADHHLGEVLLKQLPEKIKDPVAVFVSQTHNTTSVVALLKFTVNGKQVVAPIEIDGFGRQNGIVIDSNAVKSVFGKSNAISKQLMDAIIDDSNGKFALLYNNQKEAMSLLQVAGLQLPGGLIPRDGFLHSIRENTSPVKPKYENVTESQQFKRWFGDWQNHPNTASKVVNDDGTPKILYHQTAEDFTVFDPKHAGAGTTDFETPFGIFMKPTDSDIGLKGQKQMALYANIRKPLEANDRADLVEKLKSLSPEYAELLKEMQSMNEEYKSKIDDAFNAWPPFVEEYRKTHPQVSRREMLLDAEAKKVYDEPKRLTEEWTKKSDALAVKCKEEINKTLKNNGYDGVHIQEDAGSGGRSTETYIALDPEQVKSATDNIGTFDGTNPDIRYSIDEDSDTAYLAAVERGDMETAQRMVDEAAKAAGYTEEMFHGMGGRYNVYKSGNGQYGSGVYFTADKDIAADYGKVVDHLYVKVGKIADYEDAYRVLGKTDDQTLDDFAQSLGFPDFDEMINDWDNDPTDVASNPELIDLLRNKGFEGFVDEGNAGFVLWDFDGISYRIKSADPVTYDDSGNVIPLSERFKEDDPDIRYSIDETPETPDVSDSVFDEALRRAGLSHLVEDTAETEDTETAPPPRKPPERDPEEVRLDRIRAHETLANALMEAAQNEHEFRLVKNYREKAAELAEAEVRKEDLRKKTAEVNREIDALQDKLRGVDKTKREPWVMTALTDAQKRKGELLDEMDALDEKLRTETDKLLSLASAKQLRKMIRTERSKAAAMERSAERARQREMESKEWVKETVKKAREESEEKVYKARQEAQDYKAAVYKTSMDKVYKARREAIDYKQAVYRTAFSKADEKNQKYRDRLDEMAKQSMERREITIRMRGARRILGYLNTMLYHPTKQKHVPESLQALVDKTLRAADPKQFGINRDHIREMSDLAGKIRKLESKAGRTADEQKTLDAMKTKYEKLEADTISVKRQAEALMTAFEQYVTSTTDKTMIDKDMMEGLRQAVTEIEEAPLNGMTLKSLKAVEKIYTVIYHQVNTANQAFATEKAAKIDEMSTEANTQVKNAKELKFMSPRSREWAALAGIRSFLWKNMKPLTVFEAIGSDKLMEIFRRVLDAEDVWITDILEAKKALDEAKKEHGYNEWNLKERREVTTADGSKVSLTLGEMMSLYAYMFREQAEQHLSAGGFVFAPNAEAIESFKGDKGKYRAHLNDQTTHRMRKEDIAKMSEMLTEEQRAYAKAVQEYLTSLGAKGNEVSRKLYGIDLFKETAYFPIKSSHDYIETQTGKSGDPNIKSRGTFKETVPKAGNPIVLEDFMEVVGNHVNTMATYHAFVLPVEDLTRVWNYTPVNIKRDADGKAILDENGMPVADTEGEAGYNSLKAEITKKYGKEANDYILQLLRDLNGGARRESAASILDKGLTAFKRSATMLSLSTIVQQPTSILRAMAYVDAKHFKGASFVPWETVKKYAPVAAIKEVGGHDTNTGARTVDYINAKEYDSIKDAAKAAVTPEIYGGDPNVRAEAFGWLTGKADEVSWRYLFGAIVNEQAEKLGKAKDSEEVLKAAGERFAEVVRRTQVYDSTLTRSEYMRSKDGLMKMATAFGAEPTTVVSMAVDAIIKAERGDKTFLRKSAAGIAFSVIANAAAASLIYAMRDDDEDETIPEKYVQSLTSELIEGFNPLEYLPIARDIMSMLKGYEIERSDMALIGNLMEQVELITSSKRSVPDKIFGVTGAVSAFFGLPVTNVYRDFKGLVKTGQSFTDAEEQTGAGFGFAMGDAVSGQFNLFAKLFGAESGNAYELYTAYVRGDTAHYERVKARYETDKDAEMALRTELRDNDKRINQAAWAKHTGDLEVYESLVDQIESEGVFDRDIVIRAVNNEVSEIKREIEKDNLVPKDETADEDEPAESLYKASDLNNALERGDTEDFAAILAALVQDKVSTGKTEAQARASVKSSITAYWKRLYIDAWSRDDTEERKRIIAILTETGMYGNRNDVATLAQNWVKNSK